jgi:transposase-like protein
MAWCGYKVHFTQAIKNQLDVLGIFAVMDGEVFRLVIQTRGQCGQIDIVHPYISQKWTMPIRDWKAALNRFIIQFDDRMLQR